MARESFRSLITLRHRAERLAQARRIGRLDAQAAPESTAGLEVRLLEERTGLRRHGRADAPPPDDDDGGPDLARRERVQQRR